MNKYWLICLVTVSFSTQANIHPPEQTQVIINNGAYGIFKNVNIIKQGNRYLLAGTVRKRKSGPPSVIGHVDVQVLSANGKLIEEKAINYNSPRSLSHEVRKTSSFNTELSEKLLPDSKVVINFHRTKLKNHTYK